MFGLRRVFHGVPLVAAALLSGCEEVPDLNAFWDSLSQVRQESSPQREIIEVEDNPFLRGADQRSGRRVVVQELEEGNPVPEPVEVGDSAAPDGMLALELDEPVAEGEGRVASEAVAEDGRAVPEFGDAVALLPDSTELAVWEEVELEGAVSGVRVQEQDAARDVSVAALKAVEIAGGRGIPRCGSVQGQERMFDVAGESGGLGTEGMWRIEAGRTVADVLAGWSEPLGWTVSDAAGVEWRIGHDAWCEGTLLSAVSYLMDALAVAVPAPVVTAYAGNRVLLLADDGSVRY